MFSSANNFNFGFGVGEGSPTPDLLDGWIMDGRNHADPTKAVDLSYMFNGCYAFNQNLNNVSVYWDRAIKEDYTYAGVENMDAFLAYAYRWNNGFGNRVIPTGDDKFIAWRLTGLKRMSQAFRDNANQDRAALALVFNIIAPLLEDVGGIFIGHQWYSEQASLMDYLKFWFQKYPRTYNMDNFLYGDTDSTTGKISPVILTEVYEQWYQDVVQADGVTKEPGIASRIPIHMGASQYFVSVQPLKDILTLPAAEGGQFEWYITDGGPTE